jgi:glycosyltransferase involved in cell wall biosynthesis/molybdenum cofactor biosynthesis enzyme MoaA/tetratricopeptide (TPR) repeat protein
MYDHPIGALSRGAVLDVGLKCTHSCRFCYYSHLDRSDDQFRGMRRAAFRSLDDCKEILRRLAANGFINFDYTGGEPTLHPEIVEITRYAHQELGLKGRIITLGQFLMRRMPRCRSERLIDDLLDAGLTNFLFSLHAVEEELFERISGESFARLRAAMEHLDTRNFHYTTNTTVFEWNHRHLPEIAREVTRHQVYLHNFIIMNAYYEWNRDGRAFGVQARYSEVAPYLREAVEILESSGVAVNIRYAPMCAVRGMERNLVGMVGVRYDPYEWMNQAGHFGGPPEFCAARLPIEPGGIDAAIQPCVADFDLQNGVHVVGMRGERRKLFAEKCGGCAARAVCDGVDPNYLAQHGEDELVPYTAGDFASPVHGARAAYPAPFRVKTEPGEDMRSAIAGTLAGAIPAAVAEPSPFEQTAPTRAPRVSVVIPCFNYGRYLFESVTSVLTQTYRDREVIVVDDGSTDETSEVIERLVAAYSDRDLRVIRQANSGQPAIARNNGIAAARGEYILCVDADDLIAPTMLEECVAVLDADPGVAIAYTDRRDFDGVSQIVRAGEYDFARLRYANHLSYCSMFRKEAWEAVGGFRTNVKGCEDWDFWVAAGARGYFGRRIPEPLFCYRRHDTGLYQDVLRSLPALAAQIVLNNREAYDRSEVEAAARILAQGERSTLPAPPPLVSVVIPTYDRPDRLRRAVESVLMQTHENVEVIVVNDGGVEVEYVLAPLRESGKITYLKLGTNRERSAARNAGLKLARGAYVAYLDDDDWYEPEHLATLVASLEASDADVAYSDALRAHEVREGDDYVVASVDQPYSQAFDPDLMLVTNYIPIPCILHRRSCIEAVGAFDESLTTHEDWDFLIRLARKFRFLHVAKSTCVFTWRNDGTSTSSAKRGEFPVTAARIHERYAAWAADRPGVPERQAAFLDTLKRRCPEREFACSIIIPLHDGAELTEQCLVKLGERTSVVDFEVVLVDDASTDATPSLLESLRGDVQVLRNPVRKGFAASCNAGARVARGRRLVFLSNATAVKEGWLGALTREVDADPTVQVVGSKLLYPNGTVRHAGIALSRILDRPYEIYRRSPAWVPAVNHRRELQAVASDCLLVTREAFAAVGGFAEDLPLGFAAVDLCLKVRARGGRVVYQPRSTLYVLQSDDLERSLEDAKIAALLRQRWAETWMEDEDMIYIEDGFVCREGSAGSQQAERLAVTLEDLPRSNEQRRWERVAEVQRRALAEGVAALKPLLADVDGWPDDAAALRWAARVCAKADLFAEAGAFWRRVLAIEDAPDAHAALARLALEEGRLDEAAERIDALLAKAPGRGESWLLKGVLDLERRQHAAAAIDFEAAARAGADSRRCRLGLAMALVGEGRADRAWEQLAELVLEYPGDPEVMHWLLRAGCALERWTELAPPLKRYLQVKPEDSSVRFALAGVQVRLEQWTHAHAEYETLQRTAPDLKGLDDLGQVLSSRFSRGRVAVAEAAGAGI